MPYYSFFLSVLAVWRLTHLFQAEDGPFDVIVTFRRRLGRGVLGRLVDCFNCLSLWVALPFGWWLGSALQERALLWLALSGGAILLQRATTRVTPPAPIYFEDEIQPSEVDKNALLRRQAARTTAPDNGPDPH